MSKELSTICEQAIKSIYSGLNAGKLEEVSKDWIHDGKILAYDIKEHDRLLMVVEFTEEKEKTYSLLRFFPGGTMGWYVSVDAEGSLDKVFNRLLKKY